MEDKEEILKLYSGQRYIIPESDYGKAEVWRINDNFFLFEIPQFGGMPVYNDSFSLYDIDLILETVNNWT